ncbi:MAG: shikimate dehydrogenase [Dehalococcoidales bacterium]|nr:shikimate dehydrogenase [Dehalococcoidales bacterium]
MTNQPISGKTRVCGLIGDPITHSVSPLMHNAAFRKMGLDFVYVNFPVKRVVLAEAIQGMRALNIRGLNVTIPHKVAVMDLLDEIDEYARGIGAVNTIVNDGGKLKGYNTDAPGFLRALREGGVAPEGKKIVILGAGGAARGVSRSLAESGAQLVILNRHPETAAELARILAPAARAGVTALPLDEASMTGAIQDADVLVNTTSVGMSPDEDMSPVPVKLLNARLMVFDIVYHPAGTRLLREARAAGARVIGGLEMIIWQGALAQQYWTGQPAPVAVMRRAVQKARYEK